MNPSLKYMINVTYTILIDFTKLNHEVFRPGGTDCVHR